MYRSYSGGGGGFFLEDNDSNARSGMINNGGGEAEIILLILINICAVNNMTTGGSPKNGYGTQAQKCPPCGKRDPPHRKNGPHMERMYTHSAHIEKKPPIQYFVHAPSPPPRGGEGAYSPPPLCVCRS